MRSKKLALLGLIPVLLTTSAFSCSSERVNSVSSPPAADLSCPAEPDVAAMLAADPSGLAFDVAVREAGEGCRASLAGVCRWHRDRGADVRCPKH